MLDKLTLMLSFSGCFLYSEIQHRNDEGGWSLKLLLEVLVLCMLYGIAVLVTDFFALPVPPVLTGMVLFFLLLVTGVLKPAYFEHSSGLFYRHMALFLVPSIVGVMKYWGILRQQGWALFLIIVVSTIFVLITTAWVAMLCKQGGKQNDGG